MAGRAGRTAGSIGRKVAMRSKWLARRLWIVMVADLLLTGRRHLKRLDEGEAKRLVALASKSQGRPSKNLSAAERKEATALLDKLGHIELAGSAARIVLPFKPLSSLGTRIALSRHNAKRAEATSDAAEATASPAGTPHSRSGD